MSPKPKASMIFIDMDGVVSDFDLYCRDRYGCEMSEMTNKQLNRFWEVNCVADQFFANSPPINAGLELVSQLYVLGFNLCFLTSTGGGRQRTNIAQQKLTFLAKHAWSELPVIFVPDSSHKALFASPTTILVDDREKCTVPFEEAGGKAYLFERVKVNVAIRPNERTNWYAIFDSIRNTYTP